MIKIYQNWLPRQLMYKLYNISAAGWCWKVYEANEPNIDQKIKR